MDRIKGAGHINNLFVEEDPETGRPPTELTAKWFNDVQEEICNVIEAANITLNGDDKTQLLQAIRGIISGRLATEEVAGIARIATEEEAAAGEDDGLIITPAKLANALKNSCADRSLSNLNEAGKSRISSSSLPTPTSTEIAMPALSYNSTVQGYYGNITIPEDGYLSGYIVVRTTSLVAGWVGFYSEPGIDITQTVPGSGGHQVMNIFLPVSKGQVITVYFGTGVVQAETKLFFHKLRGNA